MKKIQEADLATVEQEAPEAPGREAVFSVEVVEGPNQGERFSLDPDAPGPVLIGQSSACTIRLADRQVSRRHASLDPRDGKLYLADLGSTNGTVVNGLGVERAWLTGGEVVRLGSTALRVERGATRLGKPSAVDRFGRVLGSSPTMRRLYELCGRIAATASPALIEGERGTGKELLAESIHEGGPRKHGPFVVFDCAAPPVGAPDPTAATPGEPSAIEQAGGGTLFIREIAELPQASQEALQKWLEQQKATVPSARIGTAYDVRVVSSSSRDLDREVQQKRFSAPLLELTSPQRIELPPLRERRGDVRILAARFWSELDERGGSPSDEELAMLEDSPLAGNVLELRAEVARLVARRNESGEPRESIEEVLSLDLPFSQARQRALREFQRRYVERVLARHNGNVSRAAEAAGIARRYFQIIKARKLTDS